MGLQRGQKDAKAWEEFGCQSIMCEVLCQKKKLEFHRMIGNDKEIHFSLNEVGIAMREFCTWLKQCCGSDFYKTRQLVCLIGES